MKKIFTLVLLTCSIYSQASSFSDLWNLSSEKTVSVPGARKIIPQTYQLVQLNVSAFQFLQSFIPTETSGSMSSIFLPTPDGDNMEFDLFECPVMEKALAEKYSQIKTYTAISKQDARITAKIDFTNFGFHAMVFNGEKTFFIDPYSNQTNEWYVVYYKSNYFRNLNQTMHCLVDENHDLTLPENEVHLEQNSLPTISHKTNGDTLRNYRLALACTAEYAAAVGGPTPTKATVLSAMVTSMNRCNGVFEREFSMHANMIANDDTLICMSISTEPYTDADGNAMLSQNQTTIDAIIGTANYDYGHVFSTGGGGVAIQTCVCNSSDKAQGVTGSPNPVGDPFDIDYVVHEMGHQFGGSHTFNSVTGSCSGNRSGTSAYEIGSATTIMGYAGICGTDDIQPHSDDYYHIRSLEQLTGSSIKACAVKTMATNTPPVLASINHTYIIPYRTPFELTATATDANNDPLSFCWEEYDRGGNGGAWDAATTVAPILRSLYPDSSGTRVFPQYKELIKNTESYLGEILPDTARILRFRCTVRDMHLGHGSFYTSIDTTKLDVRATSSLFRVTSQNTTGQSWNGFSTQTITWDVAGTNTAPISAANVDIYISIDSGRTFPYHVATAVANNGSCSIPVPNVAATWARVKVKATGNVFFDLNDKWIEIKKVVSPAGINEIDPSSVLVYPNPSNGKFTIELPSDIHQAEVEMMNTTGAVVFRKNIDGTQSTLQTPQLSQGVYFMKIKASDKNLIVKKVVVE